MNPKTKVYKIPCSVCGTIVEKRVTCSSHCQATVLKNARPDKDGQKNEVLVDMTVNWWEKELKEDFNIPKIDVLKEEPAKTDTQPTPQPVQTNEYKPIIMCEHSNPVGHCEFGCL